MINHESKVSNGLARSKRQGANFDVNVEMVGQEKQELIKVDLEVPVLHPCLRGLETLSLGSSHFDVNVEMNELRMGDWLQRGFVNVKEQRHQTLETLVESW